MAAIYAVRSAFLLVLVILSLSAAGCGGDTDEDASPEPAAPGTATEPADSDYPDLSGVTLTLVSYGGEAETIWKEAFADPFAEVTGARVLLDAPMDYAKVQAQVDSGNVTWDVVEGDPFSALDRCGTLFEPLEDVDLSEIDPKYVIGECAVPANVFANMLVYDPEKFGDDPPTSWADFFDTEKYPGKRGMMTHPLLNGFEAALLGDGVPPDQLYPLDFDRAIRKLDTIRDDIAFYDTLSESVEQLRSRSVVMAITVNTRGYLVSEEGIPWAPVWNGALQNWDMWAIPKGAKNKSAAEALLRFIGTAPAQADVVERAPFGPTNVGVQAPADELTRTWLPTEPNNAEEAIQIDAEWWSENYDMAVQRYTDWLGG